MQRRIAQVLGVYYEPRACVFGYVNGRNICGNASRHAGKRWVLRVDLADFFPTIHYGRVRGVLMNKPFQLNAEVANAIAALCTRDGMLPQGAPTSPILSNLVCRGLDHRLVELAREHRCSYTRYCDDLVFSTTLREFPKAVAQLDGSVSEGSTGVLLGEAVQGAIEAAGFKVNAAKLVLRPRHHRQMVTGLIVNERVNVPRAYVRGLRAVLYAWRRFGEDATAEWFFEKHYKRNRPGQRIRAHRGGHAPSGMRVRVRETMVSDFAARVSAT